MGDPDTGEQVNFVFAVRDTFQSTLVRVTGADHRDRAKLWAEWYRENKRSKWPEEEQGSSKKDA